jgi:hypothetical protein
MTGNMPPKTWGEYLLNMVVFPRELTKKQRIHNETVREYLIRQREITGLRVKEYRTFQD